MPPSPAAQLAKVIRSAARDGVLEKEFREKVEAWLIEYAQAKGINLTPHTEVTLGSSGRADTIYNNFIIEWEKPGAFRATNDSAKNAESIAQILGYVETYWFRNRQPAGRVVGCCTDGRYFIFITKPGARWDKTEPAPVNEASCQRFLDYFESLQSGVALLPEYLAEDFSSENVRTQRAVKALYESLLQHRAAPHLSALFQQWADFYSAVTDYEQWRTKLANEAALRAMVKSFGIKADGLDLNAFFFSTHTFFAIVTKLLAFLIVGRYTNLAVGSLAGWETLSNDDLRGRLADLEQGGPFKKAGIANFLEGDFFSWYQKYFTSEFAAGMRDVVKRLGEYDTATLDLAPAPTQDLLKKVYHRLVPPAIRKALGEYYTPDWLAQRVLNMLDGGKWRGHPDTRMLDPTCGSGTFMLLAINAARRNSVSQSLDPADLLRRICHNIVGIDLNPLAVIAARTNYLLALGPLLGYRGKDPLEIPVYLADSIMTPQRGTQDLWEDKVVRVWLSIGKIEIPKRLATQQGVARLTLLLDRGLQHEPAPLSPDEFVAKGRDYLVKGYGEDVSDPKSAWVEDSAVVHALYGRLLELHRQGRNGMWARILKNAFAPIFLAPFDFVAGNPPWINWQNLPEGYRQESKELWFEHGLFVHSGMDTILGKGKKDISMLLTYVAVDSYLKDGGRLGFVITQSVFKTSGAGQGFRRFVTRRKKPFRIEWVDDYSEMQLFEGATNRTAVFVARKGATHKFPVPYAYWRKKEFGRRGAFDYDSSLEDVLGKTERLRFEAALVKPSDPTSSWLTGRPQALRAIQKVLGKSDYKAHEGVNTGGANAVYWFEILHNHGDGTVTARNITANAKRKVESVQVRLEKEYLFPLLRGRDVNRWHAKAAAHLLLVQDVSKRIGVDESILKKEAPLTYQWLHSQRHVLLKRSSQSVKNLMKKGAFYSMFAVGDYTIAPWKVVWSEVANELDASVAQKQSGKPTIADHTVVEIAFSEETEANFVCGVLNSTPFRYAVSRYIVLHPDPHILENLRVPKFDASEKLHARIAEEAARVAVDKLERQALHHDRLDELCTQLWGITDKELRAVQTAYTEVHGPRPAGGVAEEAAPYGEPAPDEPAEEETETPAES